MTDLRRAVIEHLRFLNEIGVRELPRAAEKGLQTPAAVADAPGKASAAGGSLPVDASSPAAADDRLDAVRADLGDCTRCRLSESRTHIVFGVGHPHADLMFVGEAPGRDEDIKGEPFVGRAGQLLDRMIASIGLTRADVYIANVVKCRPPRNRNPQDDEIRSCSPYLAAQVEAIKPRVIVALGKFAASVLLGGEVAITRARGQLRSYGEIPLMPTFHPAYLLRQYTQENRRAVYDDLLQVKSILAGGSGSAAR